ncbi:hypothetical protein Ancab_004175 [Ancistrocladus abbreviatus]
MGEEEIEKLRGVVRDCVSKHLCSSAIFFADKVAVFTSEPADIYMQAQALFLGRHRRAFHLLNSSQIVLRDLRFRYLAAKRLASSLMVAFVLYVSRAGLQAGSFWLFFPYVPDDAVPHVTHQPSARHSSYISEFLHLIRGLHFLSFTLWLV